MFDEGENLLIGAIGRTETNDSKVIQRGDNVSPENIRNAEDVG